MNDQIFNQTTACLRVTELWSWRFIWDLNDGFCGLFDHNLANSFEKNVHRNSKQWVMSYQLEAFMASTKWFILETHHNKYIAAYY